MAVGDAKIRPPVDIVRGVSAGSDETLCTTGWAACAVAPRNAAQASSQQSCGNRRSTLSRIRINIQSGKRLFVAEGGERIDLHGAPRGQKRGESADDEHTDQNHDVVGCVAGLDSVEKTFEERRHK